MNDEESVTKHVQFSSRSTPQEIEKAICQGTVSLGGAVNSGHSANAPLQLSIPVSAGRKMVVTVKFFELLPGIRVVQMSMLHGSMIDLMKFYNKLAGGFLGDVMIKRKDGVTAHPRANSVASLASSSMLRTPMGSKRTSESVSSSGSVDSSLYMGGGREEGRQLEVVHEH